MLLALGNYLNRVVILMTENHFAFIVTGDTFRLKNAELFDGLAKPKIYEQNQIIYQQGDKASHVYYLKTGRVQIFIGSVNGAEKTLAVFSKGSLFGKSAFFDQLPRSSGAKALTKTEIICVDQMMMMDIISRHPQLALDMLGYLAKTIRLFANQIENMTFLQADRRIARYIVDNFSGNLKKTTITCTHDEISGTVGASRVTVSKILNRFAQKGWINTGYKCIEVTDAQALTDFAFKG